ncbi:MAG TPA: helix-turn-helix domain-containing protein [Micromonosporaceae bacterium]|nr:helix-turn-helix domain-containing protein [Micromonosporaceae bacterium]
MRTRQAIVSTATRLFVERGYAATSLADIAAAAGVARPTVFAAFGSKAALLRQVLDEALAGDDAPVPVAQRPWFRPVWDAASPGAVLDAYAGVCLIIARRSALLFETVRRATDDAAESAEMWKTLQHNRRLGAKMVIEQVLKVGRLKRGLERETAVDILWIFNDPAHYTSLVLDRGWSERKFRRWLASTMGAALIDA